MNRRTALALAAGLLAWVAPSAHAQQQNFTLVNATGYQINELYIGASSSNRWGNDVLGSDVLPNGRQADIRFAPGATACSWDIKIVYEDGDESEVYGANLCRISKITLTWDAANERTIFTAE